MRMLSASPMSIPSLVLLSSVLLGPACGGEGEEDGEDEAADGSAPSEECLSGLAWVAGNVESPRMHPGRDCLDCHASLGEAEEVVLGGTVYEANDELDDCFGVPGVTVQITDANLAVHELTSNDAGNFLIEGTAIATPYTVKLIYEGRERVMVTPQTNTSCNACHGETPANGAPGRILAP